MTNAKLLPIFGSSFLRSTHIDEQGLLVVDTCAGSFAYDAPFWVRGLLHAGTTDGRTGNSSGRAFNVLVRGRYAVEGGKR